MTLKLVEFVAEGSDCSWCLSCRCFTCKGVASSMNLHCMVLVNFIANKRKDAAGNSIIVLEYAYMLTKFLTVLPFKLSYRVEYKIPII